MSKHFFSCSYCIYMSFAIFQMLCTNEGIAIDILSRLSLCSNIRLCNLKTIRIGVLGKLHTLWHNRLLMVIMSNLITHTLSLTVGIALNLNLISRCFAILYRISNIASVFIRHVSSNNSSLRCMFNTLSIQCTTNNVYIKSIIDCSFLITLTIKKCNFSSFRTNLYTLNTGNITRHIALKGFGNSL